MTSNLQADLRSVIGKLKAKRQKLDGAIETLEQLLEGEPVGLVGGVKYRRHEPPPQEVKVGDLVHHIKMGPARVIDTSLPGASLFVRTAKGESNWVPRTSCKLIVDGPAMLEGETEESIPPKAPLKFLEPSQLAPVQSAAPVEEQVTHVTYPAESPVTPQPVARLHAAVSGTSPLAHVAAELLLSEGYRVSVYTKHDASSRKLALEKLRKLGAECYPGQDHCFSIRGEFDLRVADGTDIAFNSGPVTSPGQLALKFPGNPIAQDLKEALRG